jgi:2'-phosphotransferase
MLEKVVKEDSKQRYHMLYKSLPVLGSSARVNDWWIRANQGHSLVRYLTSHISAFSDPLLYKPVDLYLEEISNPSQVKMAVHGTTLPAWEMICEYTMALCLILEA